MTKTTVAAFAIGAFSTVLLASEPDPRLATVRKAFVQPVDDLEIDRPVALCFAERLSKATPIESVKTRAEADVVLRINAHVASDADRSMDKLRKPGQPGVDLHSTANIVAELLDGTKLWEEKYLDPAYGTGVECALADDLLNTLRDAMKKARDKK